MAELGKRLGKLSLAILENFVEGTLGKKFVEELRAPTDRALAIDKALESAEKRFQKEFDDDVFAEKMFAQVSDQYVGLLAEVVGKFFDHPTESDFQNTLARIVRDSFPYINEERINQAVQKYITILTEECALADASFREKVRGLADLHGEKSQQEMVDILRRVETLLAQREISQAAPSAFRSLHQLPQPPADFTGREELITQLLADFERGKGATITGLTGMGGIGKTSLGLVVAHQVAKDYPDAQIFLDLKGTTATLSAMEIMRHVILSFEPTIDLQALDETGMAVTYRSVLHGKRALLFLDNARSPEQIAPLRPPDTCAMLVTSRWTFRVPGLHTRRLDVMSEPNAKAFLLELCPRVEKNADELAIACGCLPLALRIAGSFLDVNEHWNVREYIAGLNDRKSRLAMLHQSREGVELSAEPDLLATFELSYNGISEENQKRWRMLGVFPATFDGNAAGAMWDSPEDETAKLLGLLLRYSLLDYDESSSRFSLHDLLADYALSRMNGEEEHKAHLKHASHYKDVLNAADDLYLEGGEKVLKGLRLFDLEWENIRTGQAWAAAGRNDRANKELSIAYPDAGAHTLGLRQHPRERIGWLGSAVSAAREIGDRQGEGKALGHLGVAYKNLGEIRKAIESHEQRLAIARETGDHQGEGTTLGRLGNAYADLGEIRKAIEFHEQHLASAREMGYRHGEGIALGHLGVAYKNLGEVRKAIEFHEQHLAIMHEIGDRRGEGTALANLGNAYTDLGEVRKAIEFYEGRLAIAREVGDRRGEGKALGNLGNAYADLGEIRKAIEFHEQQLAIAREIGDRREEGNALFNMGLALYDLEEKERAIGMMSQALETYQAIEAPDAQDARKKLQEWEVLP